MNGGEATARNLYVVGGDDDPARETIPESNMANMQSTPSIFEAGWKELAKAHKANKARGNSGIGGFSTPPLDQGPEQIAFYNWFNRVNR